jgi:GH24 family phage-related lysozyme (muramidase)
LQGVPLEQHQADALASFTYNLGEGALVSSTLLKLLNAKRYAVVGPHFLRWVNGPNRPIPGLMRRRAAEKARWDAAPIYKEAA